MPIRNRPWYSMAAASFTAKRDRKGNKRDTLHFRSLTLSRTHYEFSRSSQHYSSPLYLGCSSVACCVFVCCCVVVLCCGVCFLLGLVGFVCVGCFLFCFFCFCFLLCFGC